MSTDTIQISIKAEYDKDIKKPEYSDNGKFIEFFSPETFKIPPRGDKFLDLKVKVSLESSNSDLISENCGFWLRPFSFYASEGLFIDESEDWLSNKTKDGTIQLHLLNKSFFYTVYVMKETVLAKAHLLGNENKMNVDVNFSEIVYS